jgi:hypothetical protein
MSERAAGGPPPRRRAARATLVMMLIVLVAGGVLGWSLRAILCPEERRAKRRTLEEARDALTEDIREAVHLSDDQVEPVRAVVGERLAEIRRLRTELLVPHLEQQATLMDRQVGALLREEQKQAWSAFLAEKRKRWFSPEADTQPAVTTAPS